MKIIHCHNRRILSYFLLIVNAIIFLSLQIAPEKSKTVKVQFISCDTIKLEGKLWFPIGRISNKIVIAVAPCLTYSFKPVTDPKRLRYDLMLRDKLLKKGIIYFEFASRTDSILKYDWRYPISTMFTKAQDLEAAIAYIRSRPDVKDKKIILIGQSEGGATSAIVAARNNKITAVVLLSAPGVPGQVFTDYQETCQDTMFMANYGHLSEAFNSLNLISSLKEKNYEQSLDGYKNFRKETFGPLKDIVDNYDNYDTIATHLTNYLEQKWKKENSETRKRFKNFSFYCYGNHYWAYIQPEQIALRKWKPELYFPYIKCPVAAVVGTRDKAIEYRSSIINIKKLLASGGNNNFTPFILKDHDHFLENRRNNPSIQDSAVVKVVDWINRQ